MLRPISVWAVELEAGATPEEVSGRLELGEDALVFTPRDEARSPVRIAFEHIVKVRRLRGSPVLMVRRSTPQGLRRTAFYFAQPPPLGVLRGEHVERAAGLQALRSPRKKARRQNVGYLGLMNREKKAALAEWVQAVRAAAAGSASGAPEATG